MSTQKEKEDITLWDLFKIIWEGRILILKVTGVFVVIGIVIAFTAREEFKSSCRLLPEVGEGSKPNLVGLSGLAGLAGISLGETGNVGMMSPSLYPEIVSSSSFQRDLVNTPVSFIGIESPITLNTYFDEYFSSGFLGLVSEYTIYLPYKIRNYFFEKENYANYMPADVKSESDAEGLELFSMSEGDWGAVEILKMRTNVFVENITGIIVVSVELPDPIAAAQMTSVLVDKLTARIIEYKVKKAKQDLDFIQERYLEAEKEYTARQKELALFMDRNANILSSLVQFEYTKLQNQADISFEVYKGLATQLEQAKITVKKETPVFEVLEPVGIPKDKFSPNRKLIVFVTMVLGIFAGILVVIGKYVVRKIKEPGS